VRTVSSILIVAAIAAVTIGCQKASPTAPGSADATAAGFAGAAATAAKATLFTFTKVPAPVSNVSIAAGADVQIYAFHLDTDRTRDIELTSLSFMISGSLQAGSLSNFRLVFYPNGFDKAGTVVATNDGSAWTPGPFPSNFMTLRLTGFVLPQNFRGDFGVLADVSGSSYFFWEQMQTATITVNGVEQPLVNPTTCDLPLLGDTFHVN
jgi:hypothetical protein